MPYRARSRFEREVLKRFDEKLDDSEEVSEEVTNLISGSLEKTTLSQREQSEQLAEELIAQKIYESD
jgi:hypothetical protein